MVDPTPSTTLPDKKVGGNFLTKVTAGLPNWAWGVVILVGLGIGYYVIKSRKGPSSNTTDSSNIVGQTQANNQSGVNATGGYFPTTTVGGQQVPVLPPGYQPISGPDGNPIGFQPVPAPTQTTTNPPALSVKTRKSQAGTSGPYAGYDATNTGIPVRSATQVQGQNVLAAVPFGTQLQITGTALTGGLNDTGGSTLWYPVQYNGQQGFVSADDISTAGSGDMGLSIRQTEGIYR